MPNVLVLSGPALPLLKMAEEMKPEGYELNVCTTETEADEVDRLANAADFVLAFGHGVDEQILRAGKKLKLVQLCSAGYDGVNLRIAGELGIPVANNGGANALPVAEFAMTLILACHRHLPIAHNDTRDDAWMRPEIDGYDSYELFGKTVGIIGAGRIGSTLAGMLRGFETTTLYTDVVRSEKAESFGAKRVDLDGTTERIRCCFAPHQPERLVTQANRRPRTGPDEKERIARKHLPRSGRRRARINRSPSQ